VLLLSHDTAQNTTEAISLYMIITLTAAHIQHQNIQNMRAPPASYLRNAAFIQKIQKNQRRKKREGRFHAE
jgi:hypothetical protein